MHQNCPSEGEGHGHLFTDFCPLLVKGGLRCSIFGISGLPYTQTERASEDTEAAAYLW